MPRFPTRPARAFLGALALLCLTLGACAPAATVRRSPPALATTPPASRATSVPMHIPDWQRFTDPKFGFTLEAPGVFWVDPNAQPHVLSATDSATLFVYRPTIGSTPSPTTRLLAASGGLFIYASTAPTRCALQGTPVPIGRNQSITGYRYDSLAPTPYADSAARWGGVRFVAGGVYVSLFIGAGGQPNSSAYWAAYGPTWQHILASFVAGPATGAHPCG